MSFANIFQPIPGPSCFKNLQNHALSKIIDKNNPPFFLTSRYGKTKFSMPKVSHLE